MQQYLEQQANTIEQVLADHGISVRVVGGTLSPRLVHFGLELPRGMRLAGVTPALPALAERLGVEAVRLAPDADSGAPTLEVPRPDPVPVRLLPLARDVAEIAPPCTATLGQDVSGAPVLLRLDAPEVGPVLVSGDAGAGKSALLRSMAISLALHNGPDTLRLLLIDLSGPARRAVRGGTWDDMAALPHHVGEIVREPQEAKLRLRWAARLATSRAELAAEGAPIEGAHLVVLIDGLDALLRSRDADEVAGTLAEIAAGRELGVQLVAAASNPRLGEALPWGGRVVGRMPNAAAATDAAGVRGTGAEGLLGKGDFLAVLGGDVVRLQAGFATAAEVARTVTLLAECAGERLAPAASRRAGWGAARPALGNTNDNDAPAQRRGLWKAQRAGVRLLKSGS
ncbi:MAG TPA: DNA translocase FtsK [Chloroflexia bacterium]|nr:DNA translocase FtsK [Chloroflexia bacterium]